MQPFVPQPSEQQRLGVPGAAENKFGMSGHSSEPLGAAVSWTLGAVGVPGGPEEAAGGLWMGLWGLSEPAGSGGAWLGLLGTASGALVVAI